MQVHVYRAGDCAIHIPQRSLTRLGQPVECEPRVFDLIVCLIERRERAADKNELIALLWNGRAVSDASLSQLVYKARKALGGDTNACIQTVHGHGFRWIAAVEPVAAPAPVCSAVATAAAASSVDTATVAGRVAAPVKAVVDAASENHGAEPASAALPMPSSHIPSTAAPASASHPLPATLPAVASQTKAGLRASTAHTAATLPACAAHNAAVLPASLSHTAPAPSASAPHTPSAVPHVPAAQALAQHRHRLRLGALAGVLLAALVLFGWPMLGRNGAGAAAPLRLLVLPVEIADGLDELSWARLGMMGLIANALEAESGLAVVDPATVRRLAVGDTGSPARRRAWREATGAGYSLTLRLSRAGPLLQLDAALDGADGAQQRSLFGEDAGRLALDMSAVVRDWLDRRPRSQAQPGDLDGEVAATYALGADAYLRGDLDAARRYFTLCLQRSPQALQPRLQLAEIALKYADVPRATALVEEVLQRIDAQRQPYFAVDAQRVLGYVELLRGRSDAAQAAFERARLMSAATPAQRAAIFDGLASVAARGGRYADAEALQQQALALFRAGGNAIGEAETLISIGVLERMRGRDDVSEAMLLRALDLARAHDVPWQQAEILARLVQLRVGQRRFREAVRLGEPALAQLQPPAPREIRAERLLLLEIASARLELGQAAVARGYAVRALALAEKGGDATGTAMARVIVAQAGIALRQPQALAAYRQAIADCEATGQLPRAAYHLSVLAGLQRRSGDLPGLRESVAWARRLAAAALASDMSAYAVAAQAQLDAAEGHGDQALQRLLEARRDALRAQDRTSALDLSLEHASLALELGLPAAAGATLAELGPEEQAEGDILALAESWHRARGDVAAAERLYRRRGEVDAQLPPPNAAVLAADPAASEI